METFIMKRIKLKKKSKTNYHTKLNGIFSVTWIGWKAGQRGT